MIDIRPEIWWLQEKGVDGDVILSARARLSRNLEGQRFMRILDDEGFASLSSGLRAELEQLPGDWTVLSTGDLAARDRRLLMEKNIVPADFVMDASRLLALGKDLSTCVLVGYVDHLRLQAFAPGKAVHQTRDSVYAMDQALERHLRFAADAELGYLGPNPTNLGTALRLSVLVHLPGLAEAGLLEKGFRAVLDAGGEVKGYMAEAEGSLGNLYQISNQETLGWSEDELADNLENMASQLVHYERMAREEVRSRNRAQVDDRAWRAFGVLSNCRYLEMREAVELLGDLRWGIGYGLFPVDAGTATELMFLVQDAHVRALMGDREDDSRPLEEFRAELVRNRMNGVT